jgi:hypothetical protein
LAQEADLERVSIQYGMRVKDALGRTVGRVIGSDDEAMWLCPRLFSRKRLTVPLADVTSLKHGEVHLREGATLATVEAKDAHPPMLMRVRPLAQA